MASESQAVWWSQRQSSPSNFCLSSIAFPMFYPGLSSVGIQFIACHSGSILLHLSNSEKLLFLNVSPVFELSFSFSRRLDKMNSNSLSLNTLFCGSSSFSYLGAQGAKREDLWLNVINHHLDNFNPSFTVVLREKEKLFDLVSLLHDIKYIFI